MRTSVRILTYWRPRYGFEFFFEKSVNKTAGVESYKMTKTPYGLIIRRRPIPRMKQNHTFLHAFPAVLGLLAFPLAGCHDKSRTARMQEELEKTQEKVSSRTTEYDRIKKLCDSIGTQKQQFTGARRAELTAAAGKSTQTLEKVVQYREALEKELTAMTDGVAKYRSAQLKP